MQVGWQPIQETRLVALPCLATLCSIPGAAHTQFVWPTLLRPSKRAHAQVSLPIPLCPVKGSPAQLSLPIPLYPVKLCCSSAFPHAYPSPLQCFFHSTWIVMRIHYASLKRGFTSADHVDTQDPRIQNTKPDNNQPKPPVFSPTTQGQETYPNLLHWCRRQYLHLLASMFQLPWTALTPQSTMPLPLHCPSLPIAPPTLSLPCPPPFLPPLHVCMREATTPIAMSVRGVVEGTLPLILIIFMCPPFFLTSNMHPNRGYYSYYYY